MKPIEFLKQNHLSMWMTSRNEVENELSDKQSMFCICGKLATGLHERNCRKFQNEVDRKTTVKLKNLAKWRILKDKCSI